MIRIRTNLVIFALLIVFGVASAGAQNLESVARDVSERHNQAVLEQKKQSSEIDRKRRRLLEKIAKLEGDIAGEEELLTADKAAVQSLADERDRLQHEIATRLASKEELDNIFLDHIRNFLGLAEKSPYSNRQPERLDTLQAYLAGREVFDLEDMTGLLKMYFDDIEAGSQNVRYRGAILDRSGGDTEADIIRIGHMGALFRTKNNNGFLTFSPGSKRLLMSGDPGYFVGRQIASFFDGGQNEVPMDISGGVAISQLSRKETLKDRLKSGGALVIPILLVGLAAIIIAVERLIFLGRVRYNTDALMTKVTEFVFNGDFTRALETATPHRNRPTGRVLMAGLEHRDDNNEVIESAMSEAVLTQIPRLERFIGALKVLAAVAPLMGLLGTVTGMINTFQVITTHGTGDPRLMAGGISEAMITTQVGLAVAIPIMMVASFLGGRVRNLSRDMEEKGIALMGALIRQKSNHV